MRVALLGYDWPDRRTFDYTLRLAMAGLGPAFVIGAPWRRLNIRSSRIPVLRKRGDLRSVRNLCAFLHIPYFVYPHDSPEAQGLLRHADVALIAAARILSPSTVQTLPIINLHPGLIPENRGLDNIVNAVARGLPQAVTAHFIDARIDAGTIISVTNVPVLQGDSFIDMGERVLDTAVNLVVPVVEQVLIRSWGYAAVPKNTYPVNVVGDLAVDDLAERNLASYVERFAHESDAA